MNPIPGDTDHHVRQIWASADGNVRLAIDPKIASSWRRSLTRYGVEPESTNAPAILTEGELRAFRQPLAALIELARVDLDDLYALVKDLRYVVLFADPRGVIVDHRGDNADAEKLKRWGIWRGGMWPEDIEGTNGIGTCIAESRPVTVHRNQHFRARHIDLSCSAAPVFGPDGQLAAVLDVSSMDPVISDRAHAMALPITERTARAIEQRMFRERFRSNSIVCLTRGEQGSALTIALDDDMRIVGADRNARHMLRLTDTDVASGIVLPKCFEGAQELFRGCRLDVAAPVVVSRRDGTIWQATVTPPHDLTRFSVAATPLLSNDQPRTPATQCGGLSPAVTRRVGAYIESHLAENIRLEQLAVLAGLSVSHFSRAFKQTMGMPTRRYIIKRRIENAREFLANSDLSLSEIALRLGFADQSHFTRHFRHETGATPGTARRIPHPT